MRRLTRCRIGGSELAINERQLAEEIRRPERGHNNLAAVRCGETDRDLARDDEVHRFSRLTQRAYHLARGALSFLQASPEWTERLLTHARKERHTLKERKTLDNRRRLLWFHYGPASAAGGGDGAVASLATRNGHHFALPAKALHRVEEGFDDVDGQREDNR